MNFPSIKQYEAMSLSERRQAARRILREAMDNEAPAAGAFSMNVERAIRFAYAVMGEKSETIPTVLAEVEP